MVENDATESSSAQSAGSSSKQCCGGSFSLTRLLMVLVPLALIAIVGSQMLGSYWQKTARQQLEQQTLARMLGTPIEQQLTAGEYTDADGDMVADSPADDACISPDRLVFSFVAASEDRDQATVWSEFLAALSERLGRPVDYLHFSKQDDQLLALQNGELHVAVLNTGTVPIAVERAGFVPVCTFGREDGDYGYTMKMLVPAGSEITAPAKLKGHKVTFTRPTSNSGFKAALVTLKNEFQLLPERDYQWGFSLGHEESIRGVAEGRYQAAPVASDVLARVVARGDIEEGQVSTIYQSQRFPPATVGYAHNLAPELRDGIRQTLLEFQWAGTGLETEFGAGKFVPVSYKEDWAATRQVDETFAALRAELISSRPPRIAQQPPPPVNVQPGGEAAADLPDDTPAESPDDSAEPAGGVADGD